MIKIEYLKETEDVYDIEVDKVNNFFANDILVHNCEVTLPTKPLNDINDENGEIALCVLSAINWGKIREPSDFERPCMLAIRGLDALLDLQTYPVKAAEKAMKERRSLGVGIINLAYWLARNDISYSKVDKEGLEIIHEYAEAWSYYLLKASVELAKEFGPCDKFEDTKYFDGILPIDSYKKELDELVKPKYQMNWKQLRLDMDKYGLRNSTLMALMPAETSAQISNSTNGVEPVRAFVSVKQSKDGVLKQVVPEFRRLKNKYDLLWDQESPEGYLKIMAVLQKFIDQAISVNTSYNPKFYEEEKIPMSEMMKHIIMHYKYGGKTLYYFNTMDGAGEIELPTVQTKVMIVHEDGECDSCKI